MLPNKKTTYHKKSATCIAVIANSRGKLYMGADSLVTSTDLTQSTKTYDKKILKRDNILLGYTGICALGNLLIQYLDLPKIEKYNAQTIDKFMLITFKETVRTMLVDEGYTDEHNLLKWPHEDDFELVVGICGRTYSVIIENPDSAGHYTNGYGLIHIESVSLPYATGCGGPVAWGALLENQDLFIEDPKHLQQYRKLTCVERLDRAITKACMISPACGLPVETIKES